MQVGDEKNRDCPPISRFVSETIQDRAIVIVECQQELVSDLLNGKQENIQRCKPLLRLRIIPALSRSCASSYWYSTFHCNYISIVYCFWDISRRITASLSRPKVGHMFTWSFSRRGFPRLGLGVPRPGAWKLVSESSFPGYPSVKTTWSYDY